jgi:hypothetical protein
MLGLCSFCKTNEATAEDLGVRVCPGCALVAMPGLIGKALASISPELTLPELALAWMEMKKQFAWTAGHTIAARSGNVSEPASARKGNVHGVVDQHVAR